MKKPDKDKRKFTTEQDEKEGGHNYKRLRTEQQRKANNALDQLLKRKNFHYRPSDDDLEYL